jgi:hypothetical protein
MSRKRFVFFETGYRYVAQTHMQAWLAQSSCLNLMSTGLQACTTTPGLVMHIFHYFLKAIAGILLDHAYNLSHLGGRD